ncbi:MAG: TIGR01212 family radical SAM protein [Ruminococcaceae bacterium]|nr:TIGR01212 family radical SAM protein [Oscillospiraceae bacterium]
MMTANEHYKSVFGCKMYKASISFAKTCPNRDGTKGTCGCIFCSAGGSGEFASPAGLNITEQIDEAISKVEKKAGPGAGYIAYFQSFTNTYCDPDDLAAAMDEASAHPKIKALSIATRPDCLPEGIMKVISERASKIHVYIELGLQTSNDQTAKLINRCYETKEYDDAVKRLKDSGVNVITHVIFGLPEETVDQMLETVRHCVNIGTDGIKFTCLYVLKGTELEKMWRSGAFEVLGQEEYFDIVGKVLELLPQHIVVHRLTGDGPKSLLLAPLWTKDKRSVINYINRRFSL